MICSVLCSIPRQVSRFGLYFEQGEKVLFDFQDIIQWNTCQICVTKKVTKKPKTTGMMLANTVHFQLLVS
jgi:hypothetical protein